MKNKCKILILISILLSNLNVLAVDCNNIRFYDRQSLYLYCGYHSSDDKSNFWIPADVNPVMMTNEQLEDYRIYKDITACNKNSFCKYYIKKAQQENRPLIRLDVMEAYYDEKSVYGMYSLDESLREGGRGDDGFTHKFGSLSQRQEAQLKQLQDKYGDDIFDEEFKRKLNLFRQRQEYIKQSEEQREKEQQIKENQNQNQVTPGKVMKGVMQVGTGILGIPIP